MVAFSRVYPSSSIRSVRVNQSAGPSDGRAASNRRNSAQQGILPLDLILTRTTRTVCWAVIVSIQLLLVLALTALAVMYAQLHRRDSLLWMFKTVYLFSDATAFLTRYYVTIAASFAVFALVFGLLLGEMLFYSLRYCALAYGQRSAHKRQHSKLKSPLQSHWWSCCCTRPLQFARARLSSWTQTFGIRGRYFAVTLMAQEAVEIALQTSQAHASSKFVSNLALNQVYGLLICANCMSTLLIFRSLGDDSVFVRLVCVMCDLVLDFVWGVVLPFLLLFPRLVEYYNDDNDSTQFTTSAELIREEIEYLLVLSPTQYAWAFFPYISTVWNIVKLRRLLAQSVQLDASTRKLRVTAQRRRTERIRVWQQQFALAKALPRIQRAFHRVIFVYGLVVLSVSVHASGVFRRAETTPFQCVREVYPWLAARRSCSMRRINCIDASIVGASSEIAAAMDLFNADALTNLEITNCPALEIPSALLAFVHMRVLSVMSSRVKSWPAAAAVERLPVLVTLKLYHLAFDAVPLGVLTQPASMEWISVYDTDISGFADHIGDGWRMVKYLYCDACHLDSVPRFVFAMRDLLELSACDNAIADIPDAFFADRALTTVYLDGNPLQSLPHSLWQPSLVDLYIQNTNISELALTPVSARAVSASLVVFAADSPLCALDGVVQERYLSIADRFTCEYERLVFGQPSDV